MKECPDKDALAAYENGDFDEDQAARLEDHLLKCEACRAAVERIRQANTDAAVLRDVFEESLGDSTLGSWSGIEAGTELGTADPTRGGPAAVGDGGVAGGRTAAHILGQKAPVLFRDRAGDPSFDDRVEADPHWTVPDYERIQLCGEGAYGAVWAVRDRVGVYRALKILDMNRMREAKVSCRESTALETYCRKVGRHPYLIDVYHVGVVGEQIYYTMELADEAATKAPVSGGKFPASYRPLTLYSIIRRRRIQVDTAIEIIRRLLRGLAKLHSLDLVHRDIKPGNIIFVKHRPKLADIGMIALGPAENVVIGTPRYMPPDRIMDKTADTFAVGKVLHNMIAGQHPATFPALPGEFRTDSRKWDMSKVNEVLIRACSPDAPNRYQTGGDMLDDLEACADFPFRSLFEDLDSSSTSLEPAGRPSRMGAKILLAAIRAIPWILAFAALVILLAWWKR